MVLVIPSWLALYLTFGLSCADQSENCSEDTECLRQRDALRVRPGHQADALLSLIFVCIYKTSRADTEQHRYMIMTNVH